MAHKLVLTRKYQILERRVDDIDTVSELTDDATLKAFDALENIASTTIVEGDDNDDIHFDDFIFYLSDSQLAALKESVNLDDFELEEVDD